MINAKMRVAKQLLEDATLREFEIEEQEIDEKLVYNLRITGGAHSKTLVWHLSDTQFVEVCHAIAELVIDCKDDLKEKLREV
jgi:hypothetical protein